MMKNTIKERQYCGCEATGCGAALAQSELVTPAKPLSINWFKRPIQFLLNWNHRRIQRNLLRSLSDNQLRDIGLTHDDIEKEYERRVWPNWPK